MPKPTVKLKILRDAAGDISIFLNDMELETVDAVQLHVVPEENEALIRISLLVPEVDIEASVDDIQLTTGAYRRCEVCGKWVIPSIAKNLKEKTVTAEYECNIPDEDGNSCNWKKSVKIQDWNEGLKQKQLVTNMEG
jgi:hypothetical protein